MALSNGTGVLNQVRIYMLLRAGSPANQIMLIDHHLAFRRRLPGAAHPLYSRVQRRQSDPSASAVFITICK
jgi:hypothetical protein